MDEFAAAHGLFCLWVRLSESPPADASFSLPRFSWLPLADVSLATPAEALADADAFLA